MHAGKTLSILASAARTATVTDEALVRNRTNDGACGLRVIVDVTALAASPSVVLTIQGYDAAINKYFDVLVGTAITDVTGTGTYVYKIFPSATPSAGATANDFLPATWRIKMVHGDTDSITYTLDVEYLHG